MVQKVKVAISQDLVGDGNVIMTLSVTILSEIALISMSTAYFSGGGGLDVNGVRCPLTESPTSVLNDGNTSFTMTSDFFISFLAPQCFHCIVLQGTYILCTEPIYHGTNLWFTSRLLPASNPPILPSFYFARIILETSILNTGTNT